MSSEIGGYYGYNLCTRLPAAKKALCGDGSLSAAASLSSCGADDECWYENIIASEAKPLVSVDAAASTLTIARSDRARHGRGHTFTTHAPFTCR